ncbi:MAG: PQQ-binding-like beta-propeller repeat protein [Planctomycetota bacterium]
MSSARHPFAMIAVAGAAFALSACSAPSDDPAPQVESRRTLAPSTGDGFVTQSGDLTITHADWRSVGYRWDWSAMPPISTGSSLERVDTAGDVLVARDSRGRLSAVEVNSGRVRWSTEVAGPLTRFIGAARINDNVAIFARPNLFIVDAVSGNFVTRQAMDVVVSTMPVIDGGVAVFGTPTGEVYAHEFGDRQGEILPPPLNLGARQWGYLIEGSISADPVMVAGRVGVVTDSGTLFFVDPFTAAGLGKNRLYDGLDTNPVTDGERLYAASRDQSVYAFSSDGGLVWRYPTADKLDDQPSVWVPGGNVANTILYVSIPSEGLTAFVGNTGEKIWAAPGVGGTVATVRDNDPLVVDGSTVTLLDGRDGSIIEQFEAPGLDYVLTDNVEAGSIFAVAGDGHLAKFSPRR